MNTHTNLDSPNITNMGNPFNTMGIFGELPEGKTITLGSPTTTSDNVGGIFISNMSGGNFETMNQSPKHLAVN